MKAILGNQQFIKCNFCMNWYKIKQEYQTPYALNICEICFQKGLKNTCFKILDPKQLHIYDIYFKKSNIGFSETQCCQTSQILDIAQKIECLNNINAQKIKMFLSDVIDYEQDVLGRLQPIRDFVNKIYKSEVQRIQEIWNHISKQIEQVGQAIIKYRKNLAKQIKANYKNYDNNLDVNNFENLKEKIKEKLSYEIQEIKQRYRCQRLNFYKNDFRLFEKLKLQQTESNKQNKNIRQLSKDCYFTKKQNGKFKQLKQKVKGTNSDQLRSLCQDNKLISIKSSTLSLITINDYQIPRSPKNRFLRELKQSDNNIIRNRPILKKQKSMESLFSFDSGSCKQQTKAHILDILKNKSPLQVNYKSNNEKPQINKVFPQKNMTQSIYEALQTTFIGKALIELVAYRTDMLEFRTFMEMIEWHNELEIVKFVKIGLTDDHLNILLGFIRKYKNIHTLVITNNLLTDESVKMLLNFSEKQNQLRRIYLHRNYIKIFKCKQLLTDLQNMDIIVYI